MDLETQQSQFREARDLCDHLQVSVKTAGITRVHLVTATITHLHASDSPALAMEDVPRSGKSVHASAKARNEGLRHALSALIGEEHSASIDAAFRSAEVFPFDFPLRAASDPIEAIRPDKQALGALDNVLQGRRLLADTKVDEYLTARAKVDKKVIEVSVKLNADITPVGGRNFFTTAFDVDFKMDSKSEARLEFTAKYVDLSKNANNHEQLSTTMLITVPSIKPSAPFLNW